MHDMKNRYKITSKNGSELWQKNGKTCRNAVDIYNPITFKRGKKQPKLLKNCSEYNLVKIRSKMCHSYYFRKWFIVPRMIINKLQNNAISSSYGWLKVVKVLWKLCTKWGNKRVLFFGFEAWWKKGSCIWAKVAEK